MRKTEEMFKEYGAWRSKLETIETKMREEAEHWKGAAEKLQREGDVYEEVRRVVIDLYYEQKKQILLKTGDGEADKGEEDGKVEDDKKYEGILEELQLNADLIE